MFVAGDADGVVMMAAEAIKALPSVVTDLRINRMIPGIGHWTQQEAPDAVNAAILEFLHDIDG
jgi:pimeloyl-ACP methyl ester carboxylesterase